MVLAKILIEDVEVYCNVDCNRERNVASSEKCVVDWRNETFATDVFICAPVSPRQ